MIFQKVRPGQVKVSPLQIPSLILWYFLFPPHSISTLQGLRERKEVRLCWPYYSALLPYYLIPKVILVILRKFQVSENFLCDAKGNEVLAFAKGYWMRFLGLAWLSFFLPPLNGINERLHCYCRWFMLIPRTDESASSEKPLLKEVKVTLLFGKEKENKSRHSLRGRGRRAKVKYWEVIIQDSFLILH